MVPRYIKAIFVGPKEVHDMLNWSYYLFILNIRVQPAVLFKECLVYDTHEGGRVFEYFHLTDGNKHIYKLNIDSLGSEGLAKVNGGYLNGLSLKLALYNRKKKDERINAYLNPLKYRVAVDYFLNYVRQLSNSYDILIRSEREPTLVEGDYVILSGSTKDKFS